jgi:hypothetical protein
MKSPFIQYRDEEAREQGSTSSPGDVDRGDALRPLAQPDPSRGPTLWRSATQHNGARHMRAADAPAAHAGRSRSPPLLRHVPRRGDLAAPRRELLARHPRTSGPTACSATSRASGCSSSVAAASGPRSRGRPPGPLTYDADELTADHVQVSIGAVSWSGGLCLGGPAVLVAGMETVVLTTHVSVVSAPQPRSSSTCNSSSAKVLGARFE